MNKDNVPMNPSEIISGFNLSFDQGIAITLGIDAAIIYNHIVYWLKINANKSDAEMIEGRYWMYETNKQMADFFQYYNEDQISRAIKKLVEAGLIIKKCLSKNRFDRTSWYTVHDQGILKKSLRNPINCGMHVPHIAGSQPPPNAESDPANLRDVIYTIKEQEKTTTTKQDLSKKSSSFSEKSKIKYHPSNEPPSEYCLKIHRYFYEFIEKHNLSWKMRTSVLDKLTRVYDENYIADQINYMCNQQGEALRDALIPHKKHKKQHIENAESFLQLACKDNWASSKHIQEE